MADLHLCNTCRQKKPLEQMDRPSKPPLNLCKTCRNLKVRAKRYAGRGDLIQVTDLYQTNLDVLRTLADGIYFVSRLPLWITEDFLIFDGHIAILRTKYQDIVCSYVLPEMAEMLAKRNRQVTNRKVTKMQTPDGDGWITAKEILDARRASAVPETSINPLATLDDDEDIFF